MVAQRRRNNHLTTTWTRSPRWNYSRIIPEAGMVMKKASGVISPLRQGAGKSFRSPRSRDDGGVGYGLFRGRLIGYLGFRYRELLIGEEGGRGGARGGCPPPPRGAVLAWLRGQGVWPPSWPSS